jgi:putative endonuclease
MAQHNELGKIGEERAVDFLKELGYQIILVNWREKKFEIDIIAVDKDELVFVEVKTRSTLNFGDPIESITEKKQKHLIEGANYYIEKNEVDLECRFDVVSIVKTSKEYTVNHIINAFYPQA